MAPIAARPPPDQPPPPQLLVDPYASLEEKDPSEVQEIGGEAEVFHRQDQDPQGPEGAERSVDCIHDLLQRNAPEAQCKHQLWRIRQTAR